MRSPSWGALSLPLALPLALALALAAATRLRAEDPTPPLASLRWRSDIKTATAESAETRRPLLVQFTAAG